VTFRCVTDPSTYVSVTLSVAVTGDGVGATVAGNRQMVMGSDAENVPGPLHATASELTGVSASLIVAIRVTVSS
jgi:hypothetical protein